MFVIVIHVYCNFLSLSLKKNKHWQIYDNFIPMIMEYKVPRL